MTELPPDPIVRRTNQLVTTALDTLAVLLFAGAAGWWGWSSVHPAFGLATAALVVTILSAVAQHQPRPKPVQASAESPPQPGPTDPGNRHVMGI